VPREENYAGIPRGYRYSGELSPAERINLFCDRLHDYGSAVSRCSEADIAGVVANFLTDRGKRGLLVPPGIPAGWLPDGFNFARRSEWTYDELDQSEGVLTGCAVAIALTGTIILHHSAEQGRRALTLIPDYHLCVVFENQIVETVPEAMRLAATFGSAPITTISGPSATADIEMTRVKGVHGPRTLDVIITSGLSR
jgi:L-lactate dehydrogenase complex protein LldG